MLSAFVTLAVQAAILAALVYSLVFLPAPQKTQETILLLPRLPQPKPSEPMIIDARPKSPADRPPAATTTNLPAAGGSGGITAVPDTPPPPSAPQLMQQLGRALACPPDQRGPPSQLCPPAMKPSDPTALVLNPPSGVKDEARWAEEKRRRDGHDFGFEVAPGITVGPGGPGVSIVIQDPLCKLAWVLLGGGFHCGAPPVNAHPATEAQFKAALEAYHRRRGGGPPAALPSTPPRENGNEKDRTAGTGPGAGPAASPGGP